MKYYTILIVTNKMPMSEHTHVSNLKIRMRRENSSDIFKYTVWYCRQTTDCKHQLTNWHFYCIYLIKFEEIRLKLEKRLLHQEILALSQPIWP